jgi:hypothetical protein
MTQSCVIVIADSALRNRYIDTGRGCLGRSETMEPSD